MADNKDKECPKCSTINSPDNKFCKECGTTLRAESETVSTDPEVKITTDKRSSKPDRKEDPVENLMDTGKEIMGGIGDFINKTTGGHEAESPTPDGDGSYINGMITEERVGFSGEHKSDMQQAKVTLEDDKLMIKKKSFLGDSDRGEKHIRYEDITTVDLDKKGMLTPGSLQIYTTSGQFTIRKNKAHKLEPFFKKLSERVDQAKTRGPVISEKSGADELRKYAELRDDGIITEEEFQAKKREIMNQ